MSLTLFLEDDFNNNCCALREGHDGACAYLCPDCRGTQRCWACGGYNPGDDLGSGCSECDGWGTCGTCYDGMVDGG